MPNNLRVHITAIEFCQQGLRDVVRLDVTVKNSSVHVLDYNPLYRRRQIVAAFHLILTIYDMKRILFKTILGALAVAGLSVGTLLSVKQAEAYQAAPTPSGIYITVTYSDPINVRGGPNTVYYPIVGRLFPGDILPALGVSRGREWVQIAYPSAPGGVGWVYAIYVNVSGGELLVVEVPSTPTPLVTATLDATLAAAFNFQPTPSRMPTFTPPPPLTVPQFTEASTPGQALVAPGIFVVSLVLLGAIGLLVSVVLRK